MFIQSKQALEFRSNDGETFRIPSLYIGEVPAWVEQDDYFKSACADGTITALIGSGGISTTAPSIPVAPTTGKANKPKADDKSGEQTGTGKATGDGGAGTVNNEGGTGTTD